MCVQLLMLLVHSQNAFYVYIDNMLRIDSHTHTYTYIYKCGYAYNQPSWSFASTKKIDRDTFMHILLQQSLFYIRKRFRQASSMRKNGPIRNPPQTSNKILCVKEKVKFHDVRKNDAFGAREREREKQNEAKATEKKLISARIRPVGSYFVIDSFSQIDKILTCFALLCFYIIA